MFVLSDGRGDAVLDHRDCMQARACESTCAALLLLSCTGTPTRLNVMLAAGRIQVTLGLVMAAWNSNPLDTMTLTALQGPSSSERTRTAVTPAAAAVAVGDTILGQ